MSTSWFSSSSAPQSIANGFGAGTAGQLLTSNGGSAPSWQNPATNGTVTSVAATVPAFLAVSGSPITTSGTLAFTLSGTALPIANGGTARTSVPTTATASTYSAWDSNANLFGKNLSLQTLNYGAGGTVTLTVASERFHLNANNSSTTYVLPDGTTCLGIIFQITKYAGSGSVTVQSNLGTTLDTLNIGQSCMYTCVTAQNTDAAWVRSRSISTTSTTGLPITYGGTGAITKAAGFDGLSPMTTGGDIIYGGASGTGTRLANGTSGQVLTSSGGTSAPTWTNVSTGTVTSVAATVPAFLSVSGSPITTSGTLAFTLSGTALPIANGGTGVTSVTSSTTASSWAGWDANGLLYANSLVPANVITSTNQTYVASGAGTQLPGLITSTSSGTIVLTFPDHSTMQAGRSCRITNIGSGICGVHDPNGGSPILVVDTYPGMSIIVTCINPGAGSALDAWTVERLTNVPIGASLPANPYITNQGTAVILPNSNTTYNMNNKWPNLIVCNQSSGYASFVLPNPSTIPSGTKYTFRLTLSGNPLSVNTFTSATQIILMSGTDFNPAREVDIWWNGFNWVNRWFGYGTTVQNAQGNGENAD